VSLSLLDLPPRQRETVLRLWDGACPKDVATAMRVSLAVVRQYSCAVARKLPGNGSPLQKINLWRSQLILAALPDPIKHGLKPLLSGQSLSPSSNGNSAAPGGALR
jgi:hypothetical protein